MATIHRGGRKKDMKRDRYPSGQPKPVCDDFGPVEQRLKRDILSGARTISETGVIERAPSPLATSTITQERLNNVGGYDFEVTYTSSDTLAKTNG